MNRNDTPGWEGSIGPFPGQYGKPHVYARDVHSGAGNCVCGNALDSRLHVQAAPGVPLPGPWSEEALQTVGRLRAHVEELEAVLRAAVAQDACLVLTARYADSPLWRARLALGLDGATGARDINAEPGVCNCESYEPCAGECCGVGNCTCTPEVLARATAEVTGRG